jgi:hypothetical protein
MFDRLEQLESYLASWIIVILEHKNRPVDPVVMEFWNRNINHYRTEIDKLKNGGNAN